MDLPAIYSLPLIGSPIVARLPLAARWRKAVAQPIPRSQERVEQHRSIIGGLAAFSLAGIAFIGVQSQAKFGPALFDILASFLLSLAAYGIQTWKYTYLHDLIADGLRDAATTALLLFALRIAIAVEPDVGWVDGWQVPVVALLVAVAWVVDPLMNIVNIARALPALATQKGEGDGGQAPRGEGADSERGQTPAGQDRERVVEAPAGDRPV